MITAGRMASLTVMNIDPFEVGDTTPHKLLDKIVMTSSKARSWTGASAWPHSARDRAIRGHALVIGGIVGSGSS
jgi:hypothetical protein